VNNEAMFNHLIFKANYGGVNLLYFAYGSNLDWSQMKKRCPSAEFVGIPLGVVVELVNLFIVFPLTPKFIPLNMGVHFTCWRDIISRATCFY